MAGLKKFLKKHAVGEELAVLDKKLGGIVQEKLGITCLYRWEHGVTLYATLRGTMHGLFACPTDP